MQRIFYFDMMKGIAIFLVVMGHVMLFAFDINPSEPSKFIYFNMPLFFYISGYLAYRRFDSWNEVLGRVASRGMILLVPYIVFITLYHYWSHGDFPNISLILGGGERYWFLYDLFIISTFFLLFEYALKRIKSTWLYVTAWILSLALLIVMKLLMSNLQIGGDGLYGFVMGLVNYYRYYLIGYLCGKYMVLNRSLFENSMACALGFIAYFLNWYYFEYHNMLLIFTGTLGGIIVIQNFVKKHISADSHIGQLLINLGKCSLGIYVIHYFFIPDISDITHNFLNAGNPFIWQLTFAVVVAIPIVAASVFIYKLIEMNRWLFLIFFGKRFNK